MTGEVKRVSEEASVPGEGGATSRRDDAMHLLQAFGQVDDKFVLESSAPCGQVQPGGRQGKLAVFESVAARRGLAGGLGLAACLLAAGLVVFGGQSGSVTQTFEQVATTQVSQEGASGEASSGEDQAGDATQSQAADDILLATQSIDSDDEGSADGTRVVQDGDDGEESTVASSAASTESSTDGDEGAGPLLAVANPWQECASLEEAAELAGFSLSIEMAPQGSVESQTYIQVIEGDIIEVDYQDALGQSVAYVRKAKGTEDASGDYNAYSLVETRAVGAVQVELRGDDEGWSCVTWTNGGYSYAVGFTNPATTDEVEALVAGID